MRVHRGVPMLAAVVTLAGVSAPAASAFDNSAPSGPSAELVQHRPSSTPDWVLIGVLAAGGVTVAGTALGASRGSLRVAAPRPDARPAGRS